MPSDIRIWLREVTIAAAETQSGGAHIDGATLVGVLIPGDWTAADLAVQVSFDGDTWYPTRDAAGTALELTGLVAGSYVVLPAGALNGIEHVRLVSSVAQVSPAVLTIALRPFA